MRIALCFSGQPRFVEDCFKSIDENIMYPYDSSDHTFDTFAHLWYDRNLVTKPYKFGGDGGWKDQRIESGVIDKFIYLYDPIHIIHDTSCEFYNSYMEDGFEKSQNKYWPHSLDGELEPNFKEWRIKATLSNFYSMSEVCRMKTEHEYTHNFQYDWVIKCRTDVNVHSRLKLEDYNPEVFNCTGLMQKPPHINDWLCWGNSEVMDCFMNVFPMFKRIYNLTKYNRDDCWDNETLHVQMLEQMQIDIARHNFPLTVPRF